MMHHPNMHHQAMSGHPPQHMAGPQGMPGHHQMPPHQMHRDNRHVPMARVAMGPSGGGGMGGHAPMDAWPVHQRHGQRPPHPIRPMHHPPVPHHSGPPQMKGMRRYGGYASGVVYQPPPPPPPPPPPLAQPAAVPVAHVEPVPPTSTAGELGGCGGGAETTRGGSGGAGDAPDLPALANSKEKTPMCLVNELARFNKIKHQYRLTSETGPAHKKVFTVTLRLGDTEEYTAEGSSIKRAQHAAASLALTQTRHPAPPPRAAPPHHVPPHRHNGTVMPTVELNALAMKLCQPAVYTSVPPLAAPQRPSRVPRAPFAPLGPFAQRLISPGLIYRVRVCVGGRSWLGEGATPQGARHDAAARALRDLRPASAVAPATSFASASASASCVTAATSPPDSQDTAVPSENGSSPAADLLASEIKSPVSLVHELALKRGWEVSFGVKSERGPPHMRVFITTCKVGDIETEGEGNGKKISKRRAAEKMLLEMRRLWPPALLRARPPNTLKRKPLPNKKKPRNLIKESGDPPPEGETESNPISRLAMARHAARAPSPQYRVVEERGAARRREFVVRCDAPPHAALGLGPNKKTAKRRAATGVLIAMEGGSKGPESNSNTITTSNGETSPAIVIEGPKTNGTETKRKEGESAGSGGGAGGAETRQPVPGVLMMDFRAGQAPQTNGVTERAASPSSSSGGGTAPGATDQLMYLSQLIGFTVSFSDFPKRNHGSYLSLVSLDTCPPVMCHGGGASTRHSHEACARAALHALAAMGLDTQVPSITVSGTTKPGGVSNGLTE